MPEAEETKALTPEMEDYLEKLRDSGSINMMGAAPFLERRFSLSREKARQACKEWMFG